MQSIRNNPRMFTATLPAEPAPLPLEPKVDQPSLAGPQPRRSNLPTPIRAPSTLQSRLSEMPALPANSPAEVVASQFASRPTVRSVVAGMLDEALKRHYPTLDFNSANTSLATRLPTDSVQYKLTPLLDLALEHLATGSELGFTAQSQWVESHSANPLSVVDASKRSEPLDTRIVELAIRSLRPHLVDAYAEALTRFWSQDTASATSHWLWLSDSLNDTVRVAGLQQPGLSAVQRETLDQIVRYPDSAQRRQVVGTDAAQVFMVQTTLKQAATAATLVNPDLLITRQVNGQNLILQVTPAGVVTPHASMEAFAAALSKQLEGQLSFDHLSWKRVEPDGNIFDTQAAVILNRQLHNLQAIHLPASMQVDDLEQLFSQATDTAELFNSQPSTAPGRLAQMKRNLPAWLNNASAAERLAYQRNTLALASSVARHQGLTFLNDIPDIRTYAEQQLNAQLASKGYSASDLEITFKVAVGTLAGGYIEPIKMSLVDMALANLAGLPKGSMDIRLRGQPMTDPQMPQELKDLISTVNIGERYPALLNQRLLSDTAVARERAALFAEQVPLQLNMQALELKLKGQAGITAQGYRFVEAVTRPGTGPRRVDEQEITVRPLAFLRKPGATPDEVANMFLIEPLDPARGPHLLYRPMLSPALLEFASRDALLAAIQAPGELQQSILAWLPDDKARAVYGNGGFKTPHVARYGVFNEFDAPPTPAPTALALEDFAAARTLRSDLLDGNLMQYLYNSNAQSLVTLAQGQSTSDAQSRWALHKELGWLLFNTLLPVLRGPGAMAGWLLQLASVENDIKHATESTNADTTQAMVDLLVNVATLLSHSTPSEAAVRPLGKVPFIERAQVSIPLRRTDDTPPPTQVLIEEDAPAPSGLLDSNQPFDFAFSSLRGLSPAQRAYINTFSVPAPAREVTPIQSGKTQGLYLIDDKLHAHIDNHWFRVARDLDGFFVIDEHDKARTGPSLKHDGQGHWQFDIAPRLKGGMPVSDRIQTTLEANATQGEAMLKSFASHRQRVLPMEVLMMSARERLQQTEQSLKKSDKTLRTLWGLVNSSGRAADFTDRYQQELSNNRNLTALLRQRLDDYQRYASFTIDGRKDAIQAVRSDNPAMDLEVFREVRGGEYRAIAEILRSIYVDHLYDADEFTHAPSGEPMAALADRVRANQPGAYAEMVEAMSLREMRLARLMKAGNAYEAFLDEWKNDSPVNKKQAEIFIRSTQQPPADLLLTSRLEQLSTLRELSIDRMVPTNAPEKRFFLDRFNRAELNAVSMSHIELQQHEGYTADERIAVLSNLIDRYQAELRNTQALQDISPESVRPVYGEFFVQCLQNVITQAQAELADLIREEQHLPPLVLRREDRARKSASKRVFKTRDKQTLVGTLRDKQPGETVPIIDVLDPQSGQALRTYSWHQDEGEWVQVVKPVALKPTSVPAPKPLSAYIGTARKLMDEQAPIERSIQFQKRKLDDPAQRESVNPQDWSDMLEAQADRLEQVVREAQANHKADSQTATLVEQWRNAVEHMRQQAIAHRCDGYLRQAPRPENIDYLWTHGRVDIGLVKRHKPLKGGDVLTEYAIRDKNGLKDLWYAHFHYPKANSPVENYSAAHLKIPEQRYLTQKDLVRQAGQDNSSIDRILRTQIKPPLDQKLFLKL
ncbi:dermonecrotic toxin domain-containing protein [Pseudomonas khavaziana]|uniref:dermonecrotic toxin domain-containing protein n=1 Tax=Pseudomonas khavaziana TaxID=2842351 RepID=UPI001CEDA7A7|nr:DUF6543 domain-containing protein [Pseudomonas khavaziana]